MSGRAHPLVHIIDDDEGVRSGLALLVRSAGWEACTYPDAESFLTALGADTRGCLVCDLKMPGLSGLELLERLADSGAALPVIMLTGHGNVPAAVRAMKGGAVDFIEKPFDADRLIELLEEALRRGSAAHDAVARRQAVCDRAATLTRREQEVLPLVAAGRANKVIALDLGISERTVETHRSRVMKKMGARSLADLVRMTELIDTGESGA